MIDKHPNGEKQIVLNFITPHQKWGIHSTYTDNLLMLTLSRGGPIVWISEVDAKEAGIVDNDWIEAYNSNGALVARAVVSQRVKQGMCMMYHAQEKIVNVPGSETTGQRGGIHNSVTRTVLKPTHMIGGYAQLSYGFNYYGTIGTNRDEFVIIRKMSKVDWLEKPLTNADRRRAARLPPQRNRSPSMKIRAQIAMVLNLDKCIGCHTCSVTCKNVWTSREGVEYAWFNNVETKPGIGYPKDWENQKKWNGGWTRKANGKIEPRIGAKWRVLAKIFANPDLPEIDDYYEPFTFDYEHLQKAPELEAFPTARPRSLITGERMEKIEWRPELGGDPRRRILQALARRQFRRRAEGNVRPVRKHLHDVSAAAVRALPQSGLRRLLPVRRDLQARGRRHRADRPGQVPRLAHVRLRLSLQEDLLQLVVGQIGEMHLLLSAHRSRPADGLLGDLRRPHPLSRRRCSMTPTASRRRRARRTRQKLYQAQLDVFLDPNDPEVIAQARADGMPDSWLEAARTSPVWKMAMEWKVAFPLHPEYRTLPMVWYVPPLSPIQSAAEAGKMGMDGDMPDVKSLRIPLRYLANLLTAGDEAPVALGLERMLAMRAYMRAKTIDGVIDEKIAGRVGLKAGADRGNVQVHGHRQLRGPLRHPDRASRMERGRL